MAESGKRQMGNDRWQTFPFTLNHKYCNFFGWLAGGSSIIFSMIVTDVLGCSKLLWCFISVGLENHKFGQAIHLTWWLWLFLKSVFRSLIVLYNAVTQPSIFSLKKFLIIFCEKSALKKLLYFLKKSFLIFS